MVKAKSSKAKSGESKTNSTEESKPTYEDLQNEVNRLLTENTELLLRARGRTDPNRISLNILHPWKTVPSSTIWPIHITGEEVRMDVNSTVQHYEADLLKIYFLIQDPNSFFYKQLYKACISEEDDEIILTFPDIPDFACEKPEQFLTERKKLTVQEQLDWMYKNVDPKNPSQKPPEYKECSESEKKAACRTITLLNESVKASETKELRLFCEDGARFHNSFAHDDMEGNELKIHWKPNDIPIKDTDGNSKDGKKCTQIWAYFYVGIVGTEKKLSGNKAPKEKPCESYMDAF